MRILLALLLFCLLPLTQPLDAQDGRPRTIVTTDGEIDDVDSFVRLLLYANEMELQGLIYSSSMWHYKGDGAGTTMVSEMDMTRDMYGERTDLRWPGESWMQEIIGDYAAVYDTLSIHAEGYPTPESLLALVKVGNISFEGEMETDTEGSEHIKAILLDADTAKVYLQVWGGTNTIARALKSIEEEHGESDTWDAVYRRVSAKAVIYAVMDQDATYRDYIAKAWPDIAVLYNAGQFGGLAYNWQRAVPRPLQHWMEGPFMQHHVILNHGPLLANYYSYGDGRQQAGDPEHIHGDPSRLDSAQWGSFKPYDFISEGDSPAFLHLVNVGLNSLAHPSWGGWGGRLVPSDQVANRWEDGGAAADYNPFSSRRDNAYALTRWLPALQRDLAARADWCVMPFDQANHPPAVDSDGATLRTVSPGDKLTLRVNATDPDGDELFYHWFQYGEVDSYPGEAMIILEGPELRVLVPRDMESGQTLHLIAEVTDGGSPSLTRYARVVLVAE
ncbi:uncharacterized protein DUF1593 [Neolewinella xylanilytica]|uniref:Uncharacterized protein DUF1593 n=1 Tax=Neolewinella xylanilytica TaxID=1514080 RepID=A0A2S6IB06_9BACT|nr:nucleoside hydrolase-like domain-containing protein [Neolewinella xylanilytica]PPK88693.1 uncharacterized protein DUF1593 [Neolewinella xylanilytica]